MWMLTFLRGDSSMGTMLHREGVHGPDRDLDQDPEVTVARSLFIDRPSSIL